MPPEPGTDYAPKAPSTPPLVVGVKRKLTSKEIAALKAKQRQDDQDKRLAEIASEIDAAVATGRKPPIGKQLKEAKAILNRNPEDFIKWSPNSGYIPRRPGAS